MTTEATIEKTEQKNTKNTKGTPQYIGKGSYTANMLASWSAIAKRLLARGHKQAEIDFIYAVSVCPKGHEDHLNQSAAATKFFPGVSSITAKCRVLNTMMDFNQQLFAGQTVEEFKAKWDEAHRKPEPKGTRPRLTPEQKAERIATHRLKADFRESKGVGGRGRLKPEIQEEMDRWVEKHLENATAKVLSEMESENE